MSITSHRLAEMSKIITGNSNSDESQRQAQRAEYFAAEALDLRQQRQELQDRVNQREADKLQQRGENAPGRAAGGSSPKHRRSGRTG